MPISYSRDKERCNRFHMTGKIITIKDVAEMAGVSKATVSRVMNNSGYVAAETRRKIENIMEAYNYVPSALAVNLSRQETKTVGVVIPEIGNTFYSDILHGITQAADEQDLSLVLFDTQDNLEKEKRAFRILQQQKVRGIILGPSVDYPETAEGRELLAGLREYSVPIVIIDRDFENMPWDAVLYENYQCSYQAALELYQAGNRRLSVITGDMTLKIGRERFEGFRKGVEDCGLKLEEKDIYYGNFLMKRSYELSMELLSQRELPDAVYTCNNMTSLGFLKAVNEKGLEIGQDIAVMGNDRIEMLDILGIPFSCVYRDNYEMGRMALRLLQERIEHPQKARSIRMVPYQVKLKGSEKRKKK